MKNIKIILIFLFTLGFGLNINNSQAQGIWKTYTTEDGLADNHVWCINQDNEGNMWFGTKNGMSKLDTNEIWTNYLTEYERLTIGDIEFDILNHKWLKASGTFGQSSGNFVLRFDDSTVTSFNPAEGVLPKQEPVCVGKDSAGSIWVGMMDNYAWWFDGQQWHPYYIPGTRIYDKVNDIKTDRDGTLYFAHGAGISDLKGYLWTGVDTWIDMRKIAFDKQNRMWCASLNNGLRMLNFIPFQWTFYALDDGLLSELCHTVAIDSNNLVWIGFYEGAQCFDGNSWRTFTQDNGLIHHNVWDIFVEPNGDIWFGTAGGVSVFHDTTTTAVINEPHQPFPKQTVLFQNYPNPFNSSTKICYKLQSAQKVQLMVYNVTGQLIIQLINEYQHAGSHEIIWGTRDKNGKEVSSGVYYGVLQVGTERICRKLVLLG